MKIGTKKISNTNRAKKLFVQRIMTRALVQLYKLHNLAQLLNLNEM